MKINKEIDHKSIWLGSMIGMTWGFIASLIVGSIIGLLAINQHNAFSIMIDNVKNGFTYITPFAIGIGIGVKLKLNPLQIFALGAGAFIIGHSLLKPSYSNGIDWSASIGINTKLFLPGDVFGAWIGGVALVYFFKAIKWKTFLDIIIVPIIGVLIGITLSFFLTYATSTILVLMEWTVEHTINKRHWIAILLAPVLGLIMGLALSLPTSSAAIAISLALHGDAATAAIAATSAQMISFGIMTYLATGKLTQAFAVGLGTSMLQMNNFMKKPKILIVPTLMSSLMALIAVASLPLLFPVTSVTSGMGTVALYGQIFTLNENGWTNGFAWMNVVFMQLLIPIILTFGIGKLVFHKGWIKGKEMEITYA